MMIKIVLLSAFIALAAAATCYSNMCVDVGASCKITDTTTYTCRSGSFCDGNNCVASLANGANCSQYSTSFNSPCGAGYTCDKTGDLTCKLPKKWAGELCLESSQCQYYNQTGALLSGSCNNGRCSGLNSGDNCTIPGFSSCINGLYCNGTTGAMNCIATKTAGSACSLTNDFCMDSRSPNYLWCNGDGVCAAWFTVGAGGKCPSGILNCQQGLVCGNDGTCVAADAADQNTDCTASKDCNNAQTCTCNGDTNAATYKCQRMQGYSKNFVAAAIADHTCVADDYNCNAWSAQRVTPQCVSTSKCYKQACSYLSEVFNGKPLTCLNAADKTAQDKCLKSGNSSSASTFFLAPIVVIVAIIALF